jgi:formylglycine-generating enzyme required for sulfatase activity
MFRDLELFQGGERIDLATLDLSERKVYGLELTWQKRFWQGSAVEIWVDDCLRSIVVNGSDISPEFAYCDFVGSRRVDLSPYLTGGRATLEVEVENLGGPGGLSITGVGNVFFRTYRYLLAFLLILGWLYRKGRVGDREQGAATDDDGPDGQGADALPSPASFQSKLATVLRAYRGVFFVLLAVIGGAYLVWFREGIPNSSPGAGQGVVELVPAGRAGEGPKVTIPAFTTRAGAPSWATDERLNPRVLFVGDEFQMGSPDGVAYPDEHPQQRVRVSRFWLQQHEVTNEEYRRFEPTHGFTPGQERYPVVNVTWNEALAYAEWLGGSLPTEAQWEFAARGARGRKYPWGDEEPTCARANFNDCGWRLKAVGSHPGGATPKGVEDLAGNAWEWCWDWYADRQPPGDQTDPLGPTSGSVRVLRGGSFIGGPGYLRSAYRGYYHPGFLGHDIGFRVAWSSAAGRD